VKMPLRAAYASARPILLIGHSMGSVIAYDTLWQLSRESADEVCVDLITLGSPLGQRYIQQRLAGRGETGARLYPGNVRQWVNIAAVGEMTAIDMTVRNDFADMIALGLTADIRDFAVFNYFRLQGMLNVHSEYGYLVNEVTATQIRDWWRDAAQPAAQPAVTVRQGPGSVL
jgi:surfactin synthase thioesterase subunit